MNFTDINTLYDIEVKSIWPHDAFEFFRALRSQNPKTFEIRSFFFEKWLLSHV